jgi:hypothetical protein
MYSTQKKSLFQMKREKLVISIFKVTEQTLKITEKLVFSKILQVKLQSYLVYGRSTKWVPKGMFRQSSNILPQIINLKKNAI